VLEIVKKLRVHQFASQMTLEPHQRDLINFFQDYKIVRPRSETMADVSSEEEPDLDLSTLHINQTIT